MPRNPSAHASQTVSAPARNGTGRFSSPGASPPVQSNSPQPNSLAANSVADPAPEEIRLRAFQIYQRRGSSPGREIEDWEQARREILEERTATLRRA